MIILSTILFCLTILVIALLCFTNVFGNQSGQQFRPPPLTGMTLITHPPTNHHAGLRFDSPEVEVLDDPKDYNLRKGQLFEKYVVNLVPDTVFELLAWRSDKSTKGHFPLDSCNPDLHFRFRKGYGPDLLIECKWRQRLPEHGEFTWTNPSQYQRYEKYAAKNNAPLFIVVGIGGLPDMPESLYIFPFEELNSISIPAAELEGYRRRKHVTSNFYFSPQTLRLE